MMQQGVSKNMQNGRLDMAILHRTGQQEFEKNHTREEFMQIFGKNYLG